MESIYVIMVATLVGFFLLAFILLYPFYRLIKNEQRRAEDWTADAIARRTRQSRAGGDGAGRSTPPSGAPRASYPDEPPLPRITPPDDARDPPRS